MERSKITRSAGQFGLGVTGLSLITLGAFASAFSRAQSPFFI
jgi:hypothetical protein